MPIMSVYESIQTVYKSIQTCLTSARMVYLLKWLYWVYMHSLLPLLLQHFTTEHAYLPAASCNSYSNEHKSLLYYTLQSQIVFSYFCISVFFPGVPVQANVRCNWRPVCVPGWHVGPTWNLLKNYITPLPLRLLLWSCQDVYSLDQIPSFICLALISKVFRKYCSHLHSWPCCGPVR